MSVIPNVISQQDGDESFCSHPALGETVIAGTVQPVTWQLPQETPVALQINSEPYTVMMATPADLRDFAFGFLVGEGILKDPKEIRGVLVMPADEGITVDVAVPETALETSRLARRSVEGRTGCGLCGIEDISSAVRPLPVLERQWAPAPETIERAAAKLFEHQPMNQFNRSVHGAAWVSRDGEIKLVREDVGRHNALDKLIGALVRDAIDVREGFVLMTSRCSFELVQKTVTAGIGALVTVSAPTSLALDLARKSNLFLAALAKGRPVVFNS
ncbi:MAG TPA: formate dehydrogenase accessory sulfurtransferase FdhD [Hyphomicrobium sp.]|jgi:FdhD protein|nr:formate dehydrogenase accessory sulfurtransferase FdhD [Hyphomicrobium sp.]